MVTNTDPADVVRAVAKGVSRLMSEDLSPAEREQQLDELADLYAEDTDVRHPFAPLGDTPMFTRSELRAHFAGAKPEKPLGHFKPTKMHVHRTDDPGLVVFEFAYACLIDDSVVEVPCIFVVRVRDGRIVESRDYGDHLGLARAVGKLDVLTAALRG